MIELGSSPATPAAPAGNGGDLVKDATDATFAADVIEASRETPVIVDFWAPWCGPCKQLTPVLEEAVRAAKGAVKLVKVDIDQNQQIAAQLRVKSIPAVFAFEGGKPVDGFMGALPASEIKAFVKRLADLGGKGNGLDEALAQGEEMLDQGAAADAAQVFAAVLAEDAANARALGGLARAELAVGDLERARQTLAMAPPEIAGDPAIAAAAAAIELAEQTQDTGEEADLKARLEASPDDHQARYDLALALLARKDREGAVETLLELFRRDAEWNDGAAKAQLFKLFDSFGPKDPLTLSGRRRLSSMIFA
ncbi:MAG: thioredoxin [Proteobacteria bacterium]|nr:thioredoxin [Pseudomonadota bacterium]